MNAEPRKADMKSSTQAVLEHTAIPKHIAVIMDGNGRWAKNVSSRA